MKKKITTIILLLFQILGVSQPFTDSKRENIWVLGGTPQQAMIVDFNTLPPTTSSMVTDSTAFWRASSVMCDTLGNLLFYSNGFQLYDSTHNRMENCDTLGHGWYTRDNYMYGSPLPQGVISLEDVSNPNLYWLIYTGAEYNIGMGYFIGTLYYAKIDMFQGGGVALEKNNIVLNDTLAAGQITACRHANGRDWWILVPEYAAPPNYYGKNYHRLLLSPQGLEFVGTQQIGMDFGNSLGQSAFSPDGSKYCRHGAVDFANCEVDIYDFDRCTGLLSNQVQFFLQDSTGGGGVGVSPNSRYLYCSAGKNVYQFDLSAQDIFASLDTVGIWDGFNYMHTYDALFSYMQLAPDGEIYISSNGPAPFYHVIHHPNLPGDSCEIEQRAFNLPHRSWQHVPNVSNYHLGPLDGSTCDTLGLNNPVAIQPPPPLQDEPSPVVQVYPNPVQGPLTIRYSGLPMAGGYALYDVHGRALLSGVVPQGSGKVYFSTGGMPAGVYFLRVACGGKEVLAQKVVVM